MKKSEYNTLHKGKGVLEQSSSRTPFLHFAAKRTEPDGATESCRICAALHRF